MRKDKENEKMSSVARKKTKRTPRETDKWADSPMTEDNYVKEKHGTIRVGHDRMHETKKQGSRRSGEVEQRKLKVDEADGERAVKTKEIPGQKKNEGAYGGRARKEQNKLNTCSDLIPVIGDNMKIGDDYVW